jgi:hypothetical protein
MIITQNIQLKDVTGSSDTKAFRPKCTRPVVLNLCETAAQ